ncbi:death on curing protein [Algoriphagus alkaliphilus]|uniref:Death on curing protein n=1 Tax=Algoriphagus alkaliphilus TaxID=279824 RepID=A0A1G5V1Q5_9BACT|nr:type II toxin-antitoxin system death-on-curing family toxin [Algoriphagus alkaliphilus]SDA39812.1 death on curing protein [Algoriphagus alkaliphilus]
MSIDFQYFTVEYAIEVHDNIVRESGGFFGVRDRGLIESTLEHMKNDFYYPEIEDKLTHLFYSINKNHCFNDGNKRASLALSVYFLYLNGLEILAEKFILTMENIVVDVANNKIDRELLYEIVQSLLYEEDFSEELKLKIIDAKTIS